MAKTTNSLLDLSSLARLHRLDVVARAIVEGMQSGLHRSPLKGHSVDFADHRPYVAGDDLRHLDWKVLGRSDRLVLKRYEAETDMACHLVVDGSASMSYQGARSDCNKFYYASMLAATISHLVLAQQDRVAMQIFSEGPVNYLPPSRGDQFDRICKALTEHECLDGTDASKCEHIAAPESHRGLVVLFSDCMGTMEDWQDAFDRLAIRGRDVVVVWCLDPDERDLSIDTVTRFLGLENEGEIVCEPRSVRAAYMEEVQKHRMGLQELCRARRISLLEADTHKAPYELLNQLLVTLQEERH